LDPEVATSASVLH